MSCYLKHEDWPQNQTQQVRAARIRSSQQRNSRPHSNVKILTLILSTKNQFECEILKILSVYFCLANKMVHISNICELFSFSNSYGNNLLPHVCSNLHRNDITELFPVQKTVTTASELCGVPPRGIVSFHCKPFKRLDFSVKEEIGVRDL